MKRILKREGNGYIEVRETEDDRCMEIPDTERFFDFKGKDGITAGAGSDCDISTGADGTLDFIIEGNKIYRCSDAEIFLNGSLIEENEKAFEKGDGILYGGLLIEVQENCIGITGDTEAYTCGLPDHERTLRSKDELRGYKRSPRIIKKEPTDKIAIADPPQKPEQKKGQLLKRILPPLVMVIVMVVVCVLMSRGIYILMAVAGMGMTLIISIMGYFSDRKTNKEQKAKRKTVYTDYLLRVRKQLAGLKGKQREALDHNYPGTDALQEMIMDESSRLYERSIYDDDFMKVSIGNSDIPVSFRPEMPIKEFSMQEDELVDEATSIYRSFSVLEDAPRIIDLKESHLALTGDKENIHRVLKQLLLQMAFMHSYHDVEMTALYSEEEKADFDWMKWLPHGKIHSLNVTGIIDNEKIRDQVLGSLNKIIKDRYERQKEHNKESRMLPHFVFIIDDTRLAMDHSIMEYLQKNQMGMGFTVIFTAARREDVPENIKTVLEVEDSTTGKLVIENGLEKNEEIDLDIKKGIDYEKTARMLASVIHQKGISAQIPENVTFFEMYGVERPEELRPEKRWKENVPYKSLAVPLGMRGKDDIVYLNLHEKAHGPHGLVGGTSGSGKSEVIQSYILSLAVNFHPWEVGFLLIDYKGGGMSGLFDRLPHLMGTITNLDGAGTMRAMASIKSELARRQRIFNEAGVNNINLYNQKFHSGYVNKPLPHLFMISDEFAELKKEQPEFMDELVSTSRVGRSLGIHLILATQKPAGVVSDQIWSNARFKLALKVLSESDSQDLIKTPDAAGITLPGRAYLQVGYNEIYELFQSAYSGAVYNEDGEEEETDDRLYVLNGLRQGELINENLLAEKETTGAETTQLDAVVEHIARVYENLDCEDVEKPWLPPLDEKIVSPHTAAGSVADLALCDRTDTKIALGMVDIPEEQTQREFMIDFEEDGNFMVCGAAGTGKSVTIATILLSLAVKNSPESMEFYILDYGNAGLIKLRDLPHTADYMDFDDEEKFGKLKKILSGEMQRRKSLFAQVGAAGFSMYNEMAPEKLKAIFVVIDNYDVVKESGYEGEEYFLKLSRDGLGLGIYMIISATRPGAVKYAVLNNFKNKIAHYLVDSADMQGFIGRSPYSTDDIPGRALVKQDDVNILQVYTPVQAEDDIEYVEKVEALASAMDESYTGKRPDSIPVVPETFTSDMLSLYEPEPADEDQAAAGLDMEKVRREYIRTNGELTMIIGGAQSGKTNILRLFAEQLKGRSKLIMFDSRSQDLGETAGRTGAMYSAGKTDVENVLGFLKELKADRMKKYEEARSENSILRPKEFFEKEERITVVIDDCDDFIEGAEPALGSEAGDFIPGLIRAGIGVIAASQNNKLRGYSEMVKTFKDCIQGVMLCPTSEQAIVGAPTIRGYVPEIGTGMLFIRNSGKIIRIPQVI